jgi:uncharacterized membrane protein
MRRSAGGRDAGAFVLFVASVSDRNPTMIGDDSAQPPHGIQRVTRRPMLWSFALWAAVHIIGNGDSAAIVFFGLDDAQRHAFDRCQAGAARSSPLDLFSIASASFIVRAIAAEGATTWYEGFLLVGVYVLFALAFFFQGQS